MLMDRDMVNRIKKAGIISVLVIEENQHIRPVVDALLAGGVTAIELTLRTPIALEAVKIIHQEYPEMLLGVGTILTVDQVLQAKLAGADFGVAPGLNRRVMDAALEMNLPFGPGIATPSDIESALEYDCKLLKFFPAEPMGGLRYLRSMYTPYAHLDLSFVPLGGISQENLPDYAREKAIGAIGGSWIASRNQIMDQHWDAITKQARNAVEVFFKER